MSKERLGARPDFDEWAHGVVAAVKKHRRRLGTSPQDSLDRRPGVRRLASRLLAKIAD